MVLQKISIPPPRKGLEIPEGWGGGGQGSRKFLKGGGGWCIKNVFVFSRPTGSIIPICSIFVCLHFAAEPRTQK